MAFALSSPVTGATVAGLTSPTYTNTQDLVTIANAKQYVVTSLGGTQTDVSVHTVSSPFLVSLAKPTAFKPLGLVDPRTGRLTNVPRNVWKQIFLKGATPLAGQASVPILARVEYAIPAGVDSADPNEVRAFMSFMAGVLWSQASGMADSFISGVL